MGRRSFALVRVGQGGFVSFGFLLSVALFGSGCSGIQLAYDNADWLIEDRVEEYIELEGERSSLIEKEIDAFLKKHRDQLLPRYSYFLIGFANDLEKEEIARETVKRLLKDLEDLIDQTVILALPHSAKVLSAMNPSEIKTYEKNYREEVEEDRERFEERSEKRRRTRSLRRMRRFLKFFVRALNKEQITLSRNYAQTWSMSSWSYWLELRLKRQEVLLRALRDKSPERIQKLEETIQFWRPGINPYRKAEHQKLIEEWRANLEDFMVEFLNSLDRRQKLHFKERLRSVAEDFRELSQNS